MTKSVSEIMGIQNKEPMYNMQLLYILNPNEKDHGFGDYILIKIITILANKYKSFNLPLQAIKSGIKKCEVMKVAISSGDVPDLIIKCECNNGYNFIICIEIKVFADENIYENNEYQTVKYKRGIDGDKNYDKFNKHYVYLNIDGIPPKCTDFKTLTFDEINKLLINDQKIIDANNATIIDFSSKISKFLHQTEEPSEDKSGKSIILSNKELEDIRKYVYKTCEGYVSHLRNSYLLFDKDYWRTKSVSKYQRDMSGMYISLKNDSNGGIFIKSDPYCSYFKKLKVILSDVNDDEIKINDSSISILVDYDIRSPKEIEVVLEKCIKKYGKYIDDVYKSSL